MSTAETGNRIGMPKRGQHDHSPGDRRKPYSNEGGPAGRHAATHDVAKEVASRPSGGDEGFDEFADDIAPVDVAGAPRHLPGHASESTSAVDIKDLHELGLRNDELAQLQVLDRGTRLDQGGVYLDLDNLTNGEFTAMGDQEAAAGCRYIAKRDTDHELWNRLLGRERGPDNDGRPGERGEGAGAGIG
jgi:hypothetical protein